MPTGRVQKPCSTACESSESSRTAAMVALGNEAWLKTLAWMGCTESVQILRLQFVKPWKERNHTKCQMGLIDGNTKDRHISQTVALTTKEQLINIIERAKMYGTSPPRGMKMKNVNKKQITSLIISLCSALTSYQLSSYGIHGGRFCQFVIYFNLRTKNIINLFT